MSHGLIRSISSPLVPTIFVEMVHWTIRRPRIASSYVRCRSVFDDAPVVTGETESMTCLYVYKAYKKVL